MKDKILALFFALTFSINSHAGTSRPIYADSIRSNASGTGICTINTSGTLTFPNATDTLAGKATTDTFTNKTFDADGSGNSISNIENADIKAAAAIALNKLAAATASRALVSDGSGFVSPATTTATEIGYVNGVTSALQTQLNDKAPLASPTFTGTITTPVTASRALVTGASAELAAATTTATEIGYVNGVTSAIQTQMNTKSPAASPTFTGTVTTPVTASRALVTGASSELSAATTTATEIGYVNGVTSAIQTQINTKSPAASPTFTGTVTTPATASRALVTGASSELTAATTTATEIGYVNGVTSAIQTQINNITGGQFTSTADAQNLGLAITVGSNAMTIALKQADGSSDPGAGASSVKISFRNATAATGSYSVVQATAATSVVVSSGSTLGNASGVESFLYVYAINNAGAIELAISSTLYDEGTVQTSTAEGGAGASDSNAVLYSTTARAGKAIRLIARLRSNQATAGTWAAVPTEISLSNSSNASNDKIYAEYTSATNTALTYNSSTVIVIGTKVADSHNAVAAGVFTAPRAGMYTFSMSLGSASVLQIVDTSFSARVFKNGSLARILGTYIVQNARTNSAYIWGSTSMYLAKGDTIQTGYYHSLVVAGTVLNSDANYNWWSIVSQ